MAKTDFTKDFDKLVGEYGKTSPEDKKKVKETQEQAKKIPPKDKKETPSSILLV